MGLINFEKIKSECLCPTCTETQRYEARKLHVKIQNVNGYTHPFIQVPDKKRIQKLQNIVKYT